MWNHRMNEMNQQNQNQNQNDDSMEDWEDEIAPDGEE